MIELIQNIDRVKGLNFYYYFLLMKIVENKEDLKKLHQ